MIKTDAQRESDRKYQAEKRTRERASRPPHYVDGRVQRSLDGPKASLSPTTTDLAWAAGFLEGEGSFQKSNGTQGVCASQVQRDPLERLQNLLGGQIYVVREADSRNQRVYRWAVSGARARGIMMTLFTFMSPRRREQITCALLS